MDPPKLRRKAGAMPTRSARNVAYQFRHFVPSLITCTVRRCRLINAEGSKLKVVPGSCRILRLDHETYSFFPFQRQTLFLHNISNLSETCLIWFFVDLYKKQDIAVDGGSVVFWRV